MKAQLLGGHTAVCMLGEDASYLMLDSRDQTRLSHAEGWEQNESEEKRSGSK